MTAAQRSDRRMTPEEIERLMHAARVQRAQFIRDALRGLFRRARKEDSWPYEKAPAYSGRACR